MVSIKTPDFRRIFPLKGMDAPGGMVLAGM
jgi:hypothetical protein